jgi:outer membrane protein assembly factor BamB
MSVLLAGACLDRTTRPVDVGPPIARLQIITTDTAFLLGHALTLGVAAWDSAGQPIAAPHVVWSTAYPTWLPIDRHGGVTTDSSNPGGDFPVYATALVTGAADTQVLHVARPGELKWRLPLGYMPTLGGPAQGPDGTLYVLGDVNPTSAATLYAVSSRGVIDWQRRLTHVDGGNYPVVGSDGTVYVVGERVYAYDQLGSLRWSITVRPTSDVPDGNSGAIGSDGTLYAAMGYDLFALRGSNGDTLWTGPRASDAGWLLPPTISKDGHTAYVKNTGDSLYAFRAADGGVRWTIPDAGGIVFFGQGAAVAGQRLIIPNDEQLQEADTTGALSATGPNLGFGMTEPAIGPGGMLYVQVPQNYGLYGFNPADAERWRLAGPRSTYSLYGGPALATGGVLYAAALDGFYAVRVSDTTGRVVWRYPPNPTLQHRFVGAPLIGSDGTVYTFSSCDYGRDTGPCSDELFAFWADLPPEPASSWPMWRHDARRSGQADR